MANIDILWPFILSWEGGFINHPNDRGGATNKGVTIATWRQCGYDKDGDGDIDVADLQLVTDTDVRDRVLKPHYWDKWQADRIASQSVANIVVDWLWLSGKYGITKVQQLLGVTADGIVGEQTLAALNRKNPKRLFEQIRRARTRFIETVATRPGQSVFRNGWLRRLDCIQYGRLIYNSLPPATHTFRER